MFERERWTWPRRASGFVADGVRCADTLDGLASAGGQWRICYTSQVTTPGHDAGDSGSADYEVGSAGFWLKQQLGFELHTAPGQAVATIECDERHLNPHGTVHGAVIFALVDTGMGAATMTVLDESSLCATIEIHTRFLAPVFRGSLRAEINVVKAGRRIVHLDASVTDQNGDKVALASGSFAVIPGQSRNGR